MKFTGGGIINVWWIVIGFAISVFGGVTVTLFVKKIALAYLGQDTRNRTLVVPLGIIESFLYTGAILIGPIAWIPIMACYEDCRRMAPRTVKVHWAPQSLFDG